ncbi:MAG: FAD binding domain-containing protein [Terriglobia bacterium]|nr:FAD binding domain-containing protein [Terriglobia bacterium]
MRPFEYTSPKTKQQAVALLNADAAVLAGGSDLLALMKDEVVTPKRLVNIKEIPDLHAVKSIKGETVIGSLKTLGDLAEIPGWDKHFPALYDALNEAASPQIRNVATLGGNLCQRPRCWYFRNGMGLLPKDAKGESLVLKGDNRYHAILGNDGPAYFVSPSTIAPALIAYGARVRLLGPNGAREVELEKFYRIPTSEGAREHDLEPNEVVTEVVIPSVEGIKSGYYEVRQKEAFDWPLAVAAVALTMNGDTVKSARVVMGQVAPIPWVSKEAADALVGKPLNEETAMAAANASVAQAKSLGRNKYKITLAKVAVKRALLNAAKGGA